MKKFNVLCTVVILLFPGFVLISSCKKETEHPDPTTQEIIDQAVQSVRRDIETTIGKAIPTLNLFLSFSDNRQSTIIENSSFRRGR